MAVSRKRSAGCGGGVRRLASGLRGRGAETCGRCATCREERAPGRRRSGALSLAQLSLLRGGRAHQAAHAHRLDGRCSARASARPSPSALRRACSSRAGAARSGCCWYDFAACCERVGDLQLRLAEDDARLLLARRLRLARHRVLQRVGDDDVAHLDRLHRDAPRVRPLVDQLSAARPRSARGRAAGRSASCGR